MAAIEDEKLVRGAVVEGVHDVAPQIFTGPGGAQPLTFDAQERDFIEGIDHAQPRIEFETVNNSHRVADPNVFGSQVSMSIDDPPRSHALGQNLPSLVQKAALHGVDAAYGPRRHVKARIKKRPAIIGEATPQLCGINRRRDKHRTSASIELYKRGGHPVELPSMQTALFNHAVEHVRLVQAIHDDQPVDNLAVSANRQALRGIHQRNNATIDVERQTPIELELGPASGLAARERREIKVGETDRFFQLVDPIAGKKHLRHVSFVTRYIGHGWLVISTPHQEFDLVGQRWLERRNLVRSRTEWKFLDAHEWKIKLKLGRR